MAIDYLMPFAAGKEKWKDNQHKEITPMSYVPAMIAASFAYHDPRYVAWLNEEKDLATTNRTLLTGIVSSGGAPRSSDNHHHHDHTAPATTEPEHPE
jgi:hypothetical protein